MGGPTAYFDVFARERDGVRGRGETMGDVVKAGGSGESDEGHGRSDFSAARVRLRQKFDKGGGSEGGLEGGSKSIEGYG